MQASQGKPTRALTTVEVPRGLAGVVVTETELGDVRGQEGFYHYRQYSAVELAEKRTYEDVWHLMLMGELPDAAQRADLTARTAALRHVPAEIAALLPGIIKATRHGGPLDGLRAVLPLIGAASGFRPLYDTAPEQRVQDALTVSAVVPTLLTALHRLRRGLTPIEPRDDLPYAANYLYMLTGTEPDPAHARAVEQYMISTVDHGFNASTFTIIDILAELKPGRELHTNVEFYAGVVMTLAGLPRDMFTPTFAAARVVGWSANITEQAADTKIIRPAARYAGPPPPQPVPEANIGE
jgi:citrate synthase